MLRKTLSGMKAVYTVNVGAATVSLRAHSVEEANGICTWLKTTLCQICYPLLDMADTTRADMMEKLRKSPLYKHRVKRLSNQACAALHALTEDCLTGCGVEQMHDFASHFASGLQDDVLGLRNILSEYIQGRGATYGPVLARLETVRVLLDLECMCYEETCRVISEETGCGDVTELFGHMKARGVLREWDALSAEICKCDPYGGKVDLRQCKKAQEAVRRIYKRAFESELIPESLEKTKAEWEDGGKA